MDALPQSRRLALAGAALLVGVLLLAGRVLGGGGAPAGPAATGALEALPPEPPARVLVHVVGAVREPGLYELEEGNRVSDALEAAGGAGPKAELAAVNLAAPVSDGMQVVVPARGRAGAAVAPAAAGTPPGPLSLNSATVEQLDALPGIGPVTAEKIIRYREENGAFRSVDELEAVPGIGPKRLEELRQVVVP